MRPLQVAVFIVVLSLALAGVHWFLWARLVRDPALAEPWRRLLTGALVVLAATFPLAMFVGRLGPSWPARAVTTAAFTWLGASFLLFLALVAMDLLRHAGAALAWLAARGRAAPALADPERRVFIARTLAGGATLAAGGTTGLALRTAVADPRIHEVPVRLERLPRALSGLTIAQISDLHVGTTIVEKHVRRVVELTNGLRPDVVAITGDLVDAPVERIRAATAHLAGLRARHGVFFVTGNHEYYAAHGPWLAELRRYGIRVLENERVAVGDPGPGGATLDLAGINDLSGYRYGHPSSLRRALAGRDPDRSLVLLAHQPKEVGEAVEAGVELQLSGHTHGGQFFPWSVVVSVAYPYLKGLYAHREGERTGQVFVSCGTGYWGPPLRLGAPSEISRIVLVPG